MPIVLDCLPNTRDVRRGLFARVALAGSLAALAFALVAVLIDRVQVTGAQHQLQSVLDTAVAEILISSPEADIGQFTAAVTDRLSTVRADVIAFSLTRTAPNQVRGDVTARFVSPLASIGQARHVVSSSTVVTLQEPLLNARSVACCAAEKTMNSTHRSIRAAAQQEPVQVH
jgi:hypothetical protein